MVFVLMGFYGRCVSLDIVNKLFDEMFERDDFVWNEIMMVNLRSGKWEKVVELFREMLFCVVRVYDRMMVKFL